MISYFLGIPGSGKTYYSVAVIYENFAKEKKNLKFDVKLKKEYLYCYTNINELKYEKLMNVYPFDFDVFYNKINILYNMYKRDKATDSQLKEKAKELQLYSVLFVIDECHNFFSNYDIVIMWWMTYHRHIHHDIFLITQNLSLINVKYKPLAECYYKAKNLSLVLSNKKFIYTYYTDSRLSDKSKVRQIKLSKYQEVFDIYKSGDFIDSPNVILRFIKIALVLFIFLIIYMYYYFTSHSHKNIESDKNIKNIDISVKNPIKSIETVKTVKDDFDKKENEKYILITFKCNKYSECVIQDKKYPKALMFYYIKDFNLKTFYVQRKGYLEIFYLKGTLEFYDFLTQSYLKNDRTEKKELQTSDIISFGDR